MWGLPHRHTRGFGYRTRTSCEDGCSKWVKIIRMTNPNLDLAMVGNCQIASLIDRDATHVWTCWPRFDGDPVFCDLLAGSDAPNRAGRWAIELIERVSSTQVY